MNDLSKIALGTVQFGMKYGVTNYTGQVNVKEVRSILDFARNNQICTLDTAAVYGASEDVLGLVGVSDFSVITKISKNKDGTKNDVSWVRHEILESLNRLKLDSVHGVLIHNANQLLDENADFVYAELLKAKEEGVINNIGVSVYTPNEATKITQRYDIDIIQLPFNLFDKRMIVSGVLSEIFEKGVEIHARSIFLQGLLLMNPTQRLERFGKWEQLWKRWDAWVEDTQLSPLQICLAYVLNFREISKIVLGVESTRQLDEIINNSEPFALNIPRDIYCDDVELINPSNW